MILLTVGTQLPFDRLVRLVDDLAVDLGHAVFAQIGAGSYKPRNMKYAAFLRPAEFDELIREAPFLISHAGIGSLLAAQRHHKPIVLFPRRAELNEHRNDHQLATVRALDGGVGVYVARTEAELRLQLSGRGRFEPALPRRAQLARLNRRLVDFISRG